VFVFAALLGAPWFSAVAGCRRRDPPQSPPLAVPHGFSSTLQVMRGGRLYRFGPFVGYYFRTVKLGDFNEVEFVCFNERGFYASDVPAGTKLYSGRGVLAELPAVEGAMPDEGDRIRPVFFGDSPAAWLENRPEPQDEFLHFHSLYDAAGPALLGYWLSHRAVAEFTYDMGGRVNQSSPLWHRVEPGPDRDFPQIIEFDVGPKDTAS
jgi:hypothetical protein